MPMQEGGTFLSNVLFSFSFFFFLFSVLPFRSVFYTFFYYFILLSHLYIDRFTGFRLVLFSARKRYE